MPQPLSCIIIEDEPLAMERTASYVDKVPSLRLAATFDNALDAFAYLQTHSVDILLLDINLGEMSGLQLLESIRLQSRIILTTAYSEYAVKGFDLSVTDYLLKPFTLERFLQAIDKAQSHIYKNTPVQFEAEQKTFVFIKTEYRLEKVLFSELVYIEGMGDYRKFHLTGKTMMTLQTFSELESLIPPTVACRVHKSYIVALDKIESIERDRIYMKNHLQSAGNVIIPVSETYKQAFFERIS